MMFLPGTKLKREAFTTDFYESCPKIEIPVYFLSGKYDLTVNIDLPREYCNYLDAPMKGFYTFENSAHAPLFEEPERMRNIILTDVLTGSNSLADNIYLIK